MTTLPRLSVILLRLIAAFWMARGLTFWIDILHPALSQPSDAADWLPPLTTVLHAIADLLGAVGLWSTASWGGVIWFSSLGIHLQSEFARGRSGAILFDLALGLLCALAFWLESRSQSMDQKPSRFL
jgi:hypothetical protein